MSYSSMASVTWGSGPAIGVTFSYDYQRSGTAMQYKLKVSVAAVSGSSYFGYPIYLDVSLDGSTAVNGYTVKAANPSTWSSAIVYESGWMTVRSKISGTTALEVRLYSGSGSARDNEYRYSLPVSSYGGGGSSGGSSVTVDDFSLGFGSITVGSANTLTVNRPVSTYNVTLTCTLGGSTVTLASPELTTVSTASGRVMYSWTPGDSIAALFTSAVSAAGTLTMQIYRGSSYFGQKSYPVTVYAGDSLRPAATITAAIVNDNAAISAWGLCVKGFSRLQYAVTAQGQGSATVENCLFQFAGQSCSGTIGETDTITTAGTLTPSATVTDSRGRSTTVTAAPVTVWDYNPPVLRNSFAWRCDALGDEAEDGAYLRVQCTAECSPLDEHNSVTVRVRFRPVGGTFSGYTALQSGVAATVGGALVAQTAYEVELSAVDTVGTEKAVLYTSSTRQVTLHLRSGGNGAAFGKYAQSDRLECAWDAAFDGDVTVAGDESVTGMLQCGALTVGSSSLLDLVYPVGAIYLSAASTSPMTLFGGTWAALEDTFLLCAGNQYAAGTTGGASEHTLSVGELPTHSHSFSGITNEADLTHSHEVGADYDGAPGSGNYTVHSGGYPGNNRDVSTSSESLVHSHSFSGTTSAEGTGTAFSLLPPYMAVYAWKRIA